MLHRHPSNPILTAKDWPYDINTVFNPGATLLPNGDTLLVVRCEDNRGFSHLSISISKNGINNWKINKKPLLAPFSGYQAETSVLEPDENERWGVEDPRITFLVEKKEYAIVYTAYSSNGPGVSLILTPDFKNFQRIGFIFAPNNKDAALFPWKINNKWVILHRPIYEQKGHIWISTSSDLVRWGDHRTVIKSRRGEWWDANKIGLGPPPIETEEGWLILYHGVRKTVSGRIYRVGLALLDLENPMKLLRRSDNWIFGPETHYEREGDVDDVVFPTGWVYDKKSNKKVIRIYYGAADTSIAVTSANVDELLNHLLESPHYNV